MAVSEVSGRLFYCLHPTIVIYKRSTLSVCLYIWFSECYAGNHNVKLNSYSMNQKILDLLKTKTNQLGFSADELKVVAETIGAKFNDESTEEEISAEIDAIIPFLKLSQAKSSRESSKVQSELKEAKALIEQLQGKAEPKPANTGNDEIKALTELLKKSIAETNAKIDALSAERVTSNRKQKVEELFRNAGAYGKAMLENFNRLKFESDDDFEGYLSEQRKAIEEISNEMQSKGLESIMPIGGQNTSGNKPKVATDAELQDLAKAFGN